MAKLYGNIADTALLTFEKSFSRAKGQPLDSTEVYYSLEEARTYAATANAYVGQKIVVVEDNIVTHYSIEDVAGNLKELGVKPLGDGKSIAVSEDGEISIVGMEGAQALEVPRMNIDGTAIEWVPITAIVQGDGNTTYEFKDIKNTGNEKIGVKVIEHAVNPETKEEILTEKEFIFDFVSNKTFNNFKSTHDAQISGLNKEAKENRTKIEALNSDNTINKEKIDSLGTNLTTLEKKVATAETDIDNLEKTLSTEAGYIDDLQGRMTTAETDIDKVEGRVGTVEGKVTTLETSMGQVTSGVGSLKTRMTTAEGEIDTLQSNMTTAKSYIEGLKTATAANKDEIGTDTTTNEDGETVAATGLYGKIATEKARAEAAEGELSTRITNLSDTVTKDYATITYVNTEISKITHFTTEIVESIGDITKEGVLYLIKDDSITGENKDVYKEYLFVGGQAVLIGDTTTDLSNYITNEALTRTLNAYYTSAQLDEKFAKYSTTSEVESKIKTAKTEAGTATDDKLKNYVKTETFDSTIANYSTTGQIDKKLEPYAKTSDVNKSISDAIDTAGDNADTKISTALKDYTTTANLEANYLTKTSASETYATKNDVSKGITDAKNEVKGDINKTLTDSYLTKTSIEATYATQTSLNDGVKGAKDYTDEKLKDYTKTEDVASTYVTQQTYEAFVEDINDGIPTDDTGARLISTEEIEKLAKLDLSDEGNLTISGSVNADNVTGLETKIDAVVTGASKLGIEKGAQVNKIESITVNNGSKLAIDKSKNVNIDLSEYYNKTAVDGLVSGINTSVTGLDTRLTEAEADITSLQTGVTNNTTAITGLSNEISGTSTTGKGNILSRLTILERITADCDAMAEQTNTNTSTIANHETRIGTAEGKITALETAINDAEDGLTKRIAAAEGNIATNTGNISALLEKDTQIETRLKSAEDKIALAETDIDTLQKDLDTAEGAIDALEGRMDTAEGEIDTLQKDLDTAEGAIDALEDRMDTAETDITGLQAQVTRWAGSYVDGNGKKDTEKSIRDIAAEEVADIVDGANERFDTLKEIADWIGSDITGAASMNSAIQENATAIGKLQARMTTAEGTISNHESILSKLDGDVNTEGSVLNLINANKTYVDTNFVQKTTVATDSILGLVMSSDAENKISVATDGTMEVNSLNVNKLTQTTGDTLILNGGSASEIN